MWRGVLCRTPRWRSFHLALPPKVLILCLIEIGAATTAWRTLVAAFINYCVVGVVPSAGGESSCNEHVELLLSCGCLLPHLPFRLLHLPHGCKFLHDRRRWTSRHGSLRNCKLLFHEQAEAAGLARRGWGPVLVGACAQLQPPTAVPTSLWHTTQSHRSAWPSRSHTHGGHRARSYLLVQVHRLRVPAERAQALRAGVAIAVFDFVGVAGCHLMLRKRTRGATRPRSVANNQHL